MHNLGLDNGHMVTLTMTVHNIGHKNGHEYCHGHFNDKSTHLGQEGHFNQTKFVLSLMILLAGGFTICVG